MSENTTLPESVKKSSEITSDKNSNSNQLKSNVEVKKISTGLMLAQYYNSDSEDEEVKQDSNGCTSLNLDSLKSISTAPILKDDGLIPGMLYPPPDLRVIVDKTASYVLKNGKDFEDILRAKNDKRFSFLQYKDPYYKYYTFKVTGIVCPDPIQVMTESNMNTDSSGIGDKITDVTCDKKPIGN